MSNVDITVEDLLGGANIEYDVVIPWDILYPAQRGEEGGTDKEMAVKLKPLTIGVFQLILKAARNDSGLIPLLMIKESLIIPSLTLEQIKRMHVGLITFLVDKVKEISGLNEKKKG